MLNLANQITLSRVILVIPIVILLYIDGLWASVAAALLFVVAAFTDFLDGYVARHSNVVTNLGKFLDPLADKLLICSVSIMLVGMGRVPAWVIAIIVARELAVTGLRAVAAGEGQVIAADKYGKWKTLLQIIALVPLLIHYPIGSISTQLVGQVCLYLALIMTVFSGINYFYVYYVSFWSKE